jgi:chromosome segregation ATPase
MELQDELMRSKRVLDEKFFEAGKLRDESNVKGDHVVDLRGQCSELERDIDLVKSQRADMFREIQRLRDVEAMKSREAIDQQEQMRALEFDLQKTIVRINETEKIVESRSYDIRTKSVTLDDTEREISRIKDLNSQQVVEISALRKDVDRVACDCYDIRKHVESTDSRNMDLTSQIRSLDIGLKEKADGLYACRKDIENQAYTNSNLR